MRFLRIFLLGAMAGSIVLVGLLMLVNPRGEFPWKIFPQPQPNYRAIKLQILNDYAVSHHADGVILGSSRAAKLDPEDLRRRYGFDFFNMAVLGADAEDYLATWRLFVKRQGLPKQLLIGLDISAFATGGRSTQFTNNLPFVAAFNGTVPGRLKKIRHNLRVIWNAVSIDYALDAATGIQGALDPPEEKFTFRPDGVLMFTRQDRQKAAGTYDPRQPVQTCIQTFRRRLHRINQDRWKAVEQVLQEARTGNTRVTIWLTPYHPALLSTMENDPEDRALLAAFPRIASRLASEYGAQLVDLSNSESFAADPDDWYDCVHFGRENARRIEAALWDKTARP